MRSKLTLKAVKQKQSQFYKIHRKKTCAGASFDKVVDLLSAALLKRDSGTGKNFAKFLRKPFT